MLRSVVQVLVVAVVVGVVGLASAQETDKNVAVSPPEFTHQTGHAEIPDDPYIVVPRAGRAVTPAVHWTRGGYVSVQVNVDAGGNNIVGDAANEPSIAVDPTNPSRMVIGWRQFDTILSNFRQAGWGYSADGGNSWTFPGSVEPGVYRSDPVVDFDAQGNFYYNSLTRDPPQSNFTCTVFKSTDGGASWGSGVYAYGGDKQWMTIDRTSGIGQGNIYAYWTRSWSICYPGHFTRSYDGGQSFVDCIQVPGNPQWGTLAVGPDGELYLVGDGFTVTKSTTLQNPALPAQFDFTTTASLDGSLQGWGGPNPAGLLGQVWIAVDHSNSPTRGYVYMLASVSRNSTPDPLDIMFARSTDGGQTWSAPVRVNDDPTTSAWQWFGTMSVAPNGRIDAIWADTRNDLGGYDSELYYSYSEDAGQTWSVNEPLSPAFDPHVGWPQQDKLGDYYDMISDDMGAHVAYAATFNGEQDVYYLRIGATCSDAGTIWLDRAAYACESTAAIAVNDCGLNTNAGQIETTTVTIDSDTEPQGEDVLLTETGPDTSQFEGSIDLSEVNSPGVLQVSEGDTVTATYIDADNGQGQFNVEVTATALADCTAPVISNVQTADVGPRDALITFDTDEPALGSVRYGLSCGALTWSASAAGYQTDHSVSLTGLQSNTTYYYAVDAEDEAGNLATDDNGGSCYTFTTLDAADYYTELFASGNDLQGLSLVFVPDGSGSFYRGCVEEITSLPTDPTGGTTLPLSDDDYEAVTVGGAVWLYGESYGTLYVGSNGYITFGGGDTDYSESLEDHFDMPRISGLFDDLNPSGGGTVSWKQLGDRVAVTWQGVPEYYSTGANTFQVELFFDGALTISYLTVTASDGLAGLSEGAGVPPDFLMSDLSELGSCGLLGDLNCDGELNAFDIDPFVLALTDPAGYAAAWPNCDRMLADCNGDGVVDAFDIDPFVELLTGP